LTFLKRNKKLNFLLIFFLPLLLTTSYSHSQNQLTSEEIRQNLQKVQRAVWSVTLRNDFEDQNLEEKNNSTKDHSPKNKGAGFFISKDVFITNLSSIRNAHDIEDISLTQNNRQIGIENIIYLSVENQIALLRTKKTSQFFLPLDPQKENKSIGKVSLSPLIYSVNPPSLNELSFFSYRSQDFFHTELTTPIYQIPSNIYDISPQTGRPLVNEYGNLIGFLFFANKNIDKFIPSFVLRHTFHKETIKNLVTQNNSLKQLIEEEEELTKEEFKNQIELIVHSEQSYGGGGSSHLTSLMIHHPLSTLQKLFPYEINEESENSLESEYDQFSFLIFSLADIGNVEAQIFLGKILLSGHLTQNNSKQHLNYENSQNPFTIIRSHSKKHQKVINVQEALIWLNKASSEDSLEAKILILHMVLKNQIPNFSNFKKTAFRNFIYWIRTSHSFSPLKLSHLYEHYGIPLNENSLLTTQEEALNSFEAKINHPEIFKNINNKVVHQQIHKVENLPSLFKINESKIKELLKESAQIENHDEYAKFKEQKYGESIERKLNRPCAQTLKNIKND